MRSPGRVGSTLTPTVALPELRHASTMAPSSASRSGEMYVRPEPSRYSTVKRCGSSQFRTTFATAASGRAVMMA